MPTDRLSKDPARDRYLREKAHEALVERRRSLTRSLADAVTHKRDADESRLRAKIAGVDDVLATHKSGGHVPGDWETTYRARLHKPGHWRAQPGVVQMPCVYCIRSLAEPSDEG